MNKCTPTARQLQAIQDIIQNELYIRGFNTAVILSCEKEGEPELFSREIITFPVIHKNQHIQCFGGYFKSCSVTGTIDFNIRVHLRYNGNGTGLFNVSGKIMIEDDGHEFLGDVTLPKIYELNVETTVY